MNKGAALAELKALDLQLHEEIRELEDQLLAEMLPNSWTFKVPLAVNKGVWRFLEQKILQPLCDADKVGYRFRMMNDGAGVVSVDWGEVSSEHNVEIQNVCRWAETRASEKVKAKV